jgi:3-isopropylmalate dehydrogenase
VDTPLKDKGPEHIDFVIIRENTEGLYTGAGGFLKKGTPDEVAIQESINTRKGVERCLRYAFQICLKRNKERKLTLAAKTNVLNYASDLWARTFQEVAKGYPRVKTDYSHVDALCMWMIKNPEWFDVIVTDNLFGDIVTDLGAMIQGGLGIAAGGNINPDPGGVSMFEPMGGSAPKYTGKNTINPLAAISACMMMLEHLGEEKAAQRIEKAMVQVLAKHVKSLAAGEMGYTTQEVGDLVVKYL